MTPFAEQCTIHLILSPVHFGYSCPVPQLDISLTSPGVLLGSYARSTRKCRLSNLFCVEAIRNLHRVVKDANLAMLNATNFGQPGSSISSDPRVMC